VVVVVWWCVVVVVVWWCVVVVVVWWCGEPHSWAPPQPCRGAAAAPPAEQFNSGFQPRFR
jgi:hypothetical protein